MINDTEQYYVYIVTLVDEIVYIGKGQGRRVNHVLSGKSHNKFINEAYYRSTLLGEPMMEVEISQWFSKEKAALSYENRLIKENKPKFNVAGNSVSSYTVNSKDKRKDRHYDKGTPRPTNSYQYSYEDILHKDFQQWPKGFVDIPDSYEDFKVYIQKRYEDYLLISQAENPHPLKWYVYGKLISDGWLNYYDMLEAYYKELTENYEDKRKNNKGRPRKSFRGIFDMTDSQRNAFYKWQRKVIGFSLDIENEEHIKLVKDWLDSRDW